MASGPENHKTMVMRCWAQNDVLQILLSERHAQVMLDESTAQLCGKLAVRALTVPINTYKVSIGGK